ncbi:MAG: thioredoxin-dependent thiol peroxidase [Flavobacteriales bacterium]|nr:thioredoxin-dependent thiol peroxidase [Flavobacteriales bacterium]
MTTLQPGDDAPHFEGINQNGKSVSLEKFRGKTLVLYFYPHDMTPTCTVEACNLRDNYAKLKRKGIAILGVSEDDEAKHRKFIERNSLPFDLIADVDHTLLKAYGVWGNKKFMGREFDGTHRTTFIIGPDGKLIDVIKKVKSKDHAEQILESIGQNS